MTKAHAVRARYATAAAIATALTTAGTRGGRQRNSGSLEDSIKNSHRNPVQRRVQSGFTLVELLVAALFAALLIVGLSGVVGQATLTRDSVRERNELTRQARYAMDQMVRIVSHSQMLLVPLQDKPFTNWREHVREETVPPSPPEGSSSKASAVLAVSLPRYFDLNDDGFMDADDDLDGRVDEDFPASRADSQVPGIYLIDDDGDGLVDEGAVGSDDESSTLDDDPLDGVDNDGDNNIDEDPPADMNADGCPGICDVDDDGDGSIDEGSAEDDDEDGQNNEDSFEPLVFYLNGTALMQRTPVPWDEDGSGSVNGQDFIAEIIADNVSRFRVERIEGVAVGEQLVDITLELTSSAIGKTVSLQTRVRVGGAL